MDEPIFSQEAFAPVKAEMHALLQDHGVSKVSMRPVKRNYAFEDRSVTPGEQWVLKIKYPGSAQALPAGLNGEHHHNPEPNI